LVRLDAALRPAIRVPVPQKRQIYYLKNFHAGIFNRIQVVTRCLRRQQTGKKMINDQTNGMTAVLTRKSRHQTSASCAVDLTHA
jgi:hypothetical protein